MKLFGIELPEPTPENTSKAIRIARQLHQNCMNRRIRNTRKQRWDRYWVKIYDIVLEQLSNKKVVAKK